MKTRLLGVDAIRYLGAIAVVFIHTLPEPNGGFGIDLGGFLSQASRFAVPFFFTASGFFMRRREIARPSRTILIAGKRIAALFLLWSLVYISVADGGLTLLLQPAFVVRWLVTGGPAYHLWFLPSLGLCLVIAVVMSRLGVGWKTLFTISLLLYASGLLLGSYRGFLPEQLSDLPGGRNGPFFGLIFVVGGMWLAGSDLRVPVASAITLIAVGLLLHLAEAYLLDENQMKAFAKNDFLIGTVPLGLGSFLLALSLRPEWRLVQVLAAPGAYSFGIYAIHLLFVDQLGSMFGSDSIEQRLLLAALVVMSATFSVLILGRIQAIRFLLQ